MGAPLFAQLTSCPLEGIVHRLDGMVQYDGNLFIGIPVKEKSDGSSLKIRQAL